MDALPFASEPQTVQVGAITLRLCIISDLDEALEHYAMVSPTDSAMIPYYTMLWDSAKALASFLEEHPVSVRGKRVLELGCGLGLPSLVAAKLGAQVTATDYHPDNEPFFRRNAELNDLTDIRYLRMDWRRPLLAGQFDVILGSDLIYDRDMVPRLVDCAERFCSPGGSFLLTDPGRSALQETSDRLEAAGFACDTQVVQDVFLISAAKPR